MIRLELVTLKGVKFSEQVHEILLPTPDGQIGVFEHHMPLVSLGANGVISIRRKPTDSDEALVHFASHGGVIEVLDDVVRVLVDEADHADEINEAEAQKAYEHAKQLLKESKDQVSLDHAQSLIDRHTTRLRVTELRRKRRSQYK